MRNQKFDYRVLVITIRFTSELGNDIVSSLYASLTGISAPSLVSLGLFLELLHMTYMWSSSRPISSLLSLPYDEMFEISET